MSKQDRQGVRTPTDIERKYDLGQIAAARGLTTQQEQRLNQLNQTFSQFMATTNAKLEELIKELSNTTSGSVARIGEVTLLADAWSGEGNLYHQVVAIEGVTENSQVDLTPNVQQLAIFYEKDLTFVTENVNGTVTVYAIGQKPLNDYIIQVTITEVEV